MFKYFFNIIICSQFRLNIAPFRFIMSPFRSVVTPFRSITGTDPGGGAYPPPPLKLEKISFFGVKSWFFTRNTPQIVAPTSARRNFFKCAPNSVEILDPPLHYHSISVIRLGVFFALNLFVHGSLYTLCV